MTGATLPGGASVGYGYAAAGRQVSQTAGGSTTSFLWDEQSPYGDIVLEADGSSGAVQASYTLGNGALLAQTRGGSVSYYLPDGREMASAGADETVQVWDAVSGRQQFTFSGHRGHGAPHLVAWSPDGRRIISAGGNDGVVFIWAAR